MARARVLSFMSTFAGQPRSSTPERQQNAPQSSNLSGEVVVQSLSSAAIAQGDAPAPTNPGRQRDSSRPISIIGGYQPPLMEIASDTIPELAPVFSFLNSHSNKLYQEGYFLRLNDLDTHGRPYPDRSWTECFAQLVGTVLSLWDAAALDAAGHDGEVTPTFINLADASIETLPTRSQSMEPLTNVLSISTAGKNRYLFHFSNVTALTQWTAGIRLAMFENASLQEAYTGSLIAGKGKSLNNIRTIMVQTKFKTEEWTRVRFGAGTPWRRCWCVISPPDEKEITAYKKQTKKKSAYDRQLMPLKGSVKFFDTSKTRKVQPIATISDAYAAYSIYPQSKSLIDQSTLIKIEGVITVHSTPETTTEGFIFVMPEVRPAISGFEMMLRFLFPIYDVFALYGRPIRLAADTLDTRSLMFAMPQNRRYGYLEIFDVATLIHGSDSTSWSEREWKKQLKQLTSQRLSRASNSQNDSRTDSRHSHRNSLPSRTALRFQHNVSTSYTPLLKDERELEVTPTQPLHTGSAPPGSGPFQPPSGSARHYRSVSESFNHGGSPRRKMEGTPYSSSRISRNPARGSLEEENNRAPSPPPHGSVTVKEMTLTEGDPHDDGSGSESENKVVIASEYNGHTSDVHHQLAPDLPFGPVAAPPAFSYEPGAKPQTRPYQSPELRRANSRMSSTTLSQLAAAGNASSVQKSGNLANAGAAAAWDRVQGDHEIFLEDGQRGVNQYHAASPDLITADGFNYEGTALGSGRFDNGNTLAPSYNRTNTRAISRHLQNQNSSLNTINRSSADNYNTTNQLPSAITSKALETDYTAAFDSQNLTRQNLETSETSETSWASLQEDHIERALPNDTKSYQTEPRLQLSARHSIARKPVGSSFQKLDVAQDNTIRSSNGNHRIDGTSMNRASTVRTVESTESGSRQYCGNSSCYDDSLPSPSYASTLDSSGLCKQRHPVRNTGARTGVLRTVGISGESTNPTPTSNLQQGFASGRTTDSDNWNIDFGPTLIYKPDDYLTQPHTGEAKPHSRTEKLGKSIDGRKSGYHGRRTASGKSRLVILENTDRLPPYSESAERVESVVWQPGVSTILPQGVLTPEKFVQQKATNNRVALGHANARHHPVYQLYNSRQVLRTPSPTLRHTSGDWTNSQPSPPTRPHSRGASPTPNVSQSLSAREQEHVARVTGSPFLYNVKGQSSRPSSQSGLVAAIEEREREKNNFKSGANRLVQQAISQRQHNQQFASYMSSLDTTQEPFIHDPRQLALGHIKVKETQENSGRVIVPQRLPSSYIPVSTVSHPMPQTSLHSRSHSSPHSR